MTIVCVDDHPVMLKGLAQNIQRILPEANTHAFYDTDAAMDFVQENGCDILISEIEFGNKLNGLSLARKVKTLLPKVNIVFLTVCDEQEHAREVLDIKPSGYLVKPAKEEQLEYELKNLRYPIH